MSALNGRQFWKMTGSGNDFVFFDNRAGQNDDLADPRTIGRLCDRRNGIGADGLVLIDTAPGFAFRMRYYNRDGSLAEMCGNAALCSARLAIVAGFVAETSGQGDFTFDTVSGPVTARIRAGSPEIDMVPVSDLNAEFAIPLSSGETRLGFVRVGVPHVVVLCDDVASVPLLQRGSAIRHHAALSAGANANFVSSDGARWHVRTYERGVEEETLACGTGSVAVAAMLVEWGLADNRGVDLRTASGREVWASPGDSASPPLLRGEGRVVFEGRLQDI